MGDYQSALNLADDLYKSAQERKDGKDRSKAKKLGEIIDDMQSIITGTRSCKAGNTIPNPGG